MKKEYHRDTNSSWAIFKAGHVFDSLGAPAPYWGCHVVYTWSQYRHVYWVYSVQVFGFGDADRKVTEEFEVGSLREVHRYLNHFKDMEECLQKVYGE